MSANVWLVRDVPERDFGPSAAWGRLCVAYPPSISPMDIPAQHRCFDQDVLRAAGAGDFILTAGPTLMVAVFAVRWRERFGSVSFLVHDARAHAYIVRRV